MGASISLKGVNYNAYRWRNRDQSTNDAIQQMQTKNANNIVVPSRQLTIHIYTYLLPNYAHPSQE